MFKNKKEEKKKARVEAFIAEVKPLTVKHKIDISAQLQYTPQGIKPQVVFIFTDENASKDNKKQG